LMAGSKGPFDVVTDKANAPVSSATGRPAFFRLILLLIVAALLIFGLAVGDTEEILFKGSIL
jgi:hypothetical protein